MLSAEKLCQSSSISGPVATAKPRSAKISASSSITWLTGWMLPREHRFGGQRHVDALGGEARFERGAFQRGLARRDRGRDALRAGRDFRALALPFLGRHRAQRLEQPGDDAALAERADAQGLDGIGRVRFFDVGQQGRS